MKTYICFWREHWLNRLLTRNKYGHCNILIQPVPDDAGYYINMSRLPELTGMIDAKFYNEKYGKPELIIDYHMDMDNIAESLRYALIPLNLRRILRHNCVVECFIALFGKKESYRKMYKRIREVTRNE